MAAFFKSNDTGILIIRIAVGVLLPFHGISKLINGIGWMDKLLNEFGIPSFVGYGVFIGEIIAPICLLIGFRTRIAGLIVAINMFMAIFLVLREKVFALKDGGGLAIELEILFLLGALSLFFTGGGKYAASSKSNWD
jgi:putative oxidoreductase